MPAARVSARESSWRVHRFEVWSGELVCVVEILRMQDSMLVWVGAPAGGSGALGDIALGSPSSCGDARSSIATTLLGDEREGAALGLARRLTAALSQPVLVCLGMQLDRFSGPLIERALIVEMKNRPDYFTIANKT